MHRLAFLVALMCATVAYSANPKASALAKDADRLYKDNKYKEAAEKLREAYDIEPSGLYLYNIARAYDQAGELETALEYYRGYVGLDAADTQPDLIKKANLAMDRLRTLVARAEAAKQVNDAEKSRLQSDAAKAEARADAEAAEARKQRQEFEEKEKQRKAQEAQTVNVRKIAAYGTGGLAIAGLGTALGCGIASVVNREAFRTAPDLEAKQAREAETRTTAAIADISLLVGIAAGVTAVILYPKGEPPAGAVKVVVTPINGGGFASVGASF
ncbi:MAG: tetratricopeptide repeat protein [Archangium sp.]